MKNTVPVRPFVVVTLMHSKCFNSAAALMISSTSKALRGFAAMASPSSKRSWEHSFMTEPSFPVVTMLAERY